MSKNKHIGSSFDEFLEEEGIHAEVAERAVKRVLAWHIRQEMKQKNMRWMFGFTMKIIILPALRGIWFLENSRNGR